MPPKSRRQRTYDDQLRRVRMRNRFAVLVGLLAIVSTIYFVWFLVPPPPPTIHVVLEYVNHTGARKIPFAESSCELLQTTFQDATHCVVEDVHSISEKKSASEMPDPNVSGPTSLLVYRTGHVINSSAVNTPTDQTVDLDATQDDVLFIGPELGSQLGNLDDVLKQIDQSGAKVKVLLLDAGRYSWSPRFPGRPFNQFVSTLDEKLRQNELQLDSNFWVITSHGDYEISHVSTPLEASVFARAIADTIKQLHENGDTVTELDVPELFARIKQRTMSYARNFENKSLQQPVLLQANVGIVGPQQAARNPSSSTLAFQWKPQPAEDLPGENQPRQNEEFTWDVFTDRDLSGGTQFAEWLFGPHRIAAKPYEATQKLEAFLELGDIGSSWLEGDEAEKQYARAFLETNEPRVPTLFDRGKVLQKREQVDQFRQRVFVLGVWQRLRNEFRLLSEPDATKVADRVRPLRSISVSDDRITRSESAVDDSDRMIKDWDVAGLDQKTLNEYRKRLEYLLSRADKSEESLTPIQAELLGVLGYRMLPLLEASGAVSVETDGDGQDPELASGPSRFRLDLEPDTNVERYAPGDQSFKKLLVDAMLETKLASLENAQRSDTALRFYLATEGSERAPRPDRLLLPDIYWAPLKPELRILTDVPGNRFRLPVFSTKPIRLTLETVALEGADLSIQTSDDTANGLDFGFDPSFTEVTRKVRNLANRDAETSLPIYLRYENSDPDAIGKRMNLELVANSWSSDPDAQPLTTRLPISIEITRDELLLQVKREFGNRSNDSFRVSFQRWNTPMVRDRWESLTLETLANIRSPFKFSVFNYSVQEKQLAFQLFRINDSFATRDLQVDVTDQLNFDAARDAMEMLRKDVSTDGDQALLKSDQFTLLATAELKVAGGGNEGQIEFQSIPVPEPEAGTEAPPRPEGPVAEKIERGLLLVAYDQQAIRGEGESRKPDWFQLIRYQPRHAGTMQDQQQQLRTRPDLVDVFGEQQLEQIPDYLVPEVDPKQAAVLTTIVAESYQDNRHYVNPYRFREILQDAPLKPMVDLSQQKNGLLLIELMGVPGYAAYKSSGLSNIPASFPLVGARVNKMPEGWACYPRTWSFASTGQLDDSFHWLVKNPEQERKIFIRRPADATGEIEIELMLPGSTGGTLSSEPDNWTLGGEDFQGRTLRFPRQREHWLAVGSGQLIAWSRIKAHPEVLSNISQRALIIRNSQGRVLGRWQFVTQSYERRPSLAVPDQVTLLESELANAEVTIDVGEILPAVTPESIKLSWDEFKVNRPEQLLRPNQTELDGQYVFSLKEWMDAAGVKFTELQPGQRIELTVEVTDFFGVTTLDKSVFNVVKQAVKTSPPKPEPGNVVIELKRDDGIRSLHGVEELRINGVVIPIGTVFNFRGQQIKAVVKTSLKSIEILKLPPGKYVFSVRARIKRENSNTQITVDGRSRSAQVKSGDQQQVELYLND